MTICHPLKSYLGALGPDSPAEPQWRRPAVYTLTGLNPVSSFLPLGFSKAVPPAMDTVSPHLLAWRTSTQVSTEMSLPPGNFP